MAVRAAKNAESKAYIHHMDYYFSIKLLQIGLKVGSEIVCLKPPCGKGIFGIACNL
jgi:hypothetical protein